MLFVLTSLIRINKISMICYFYCFYSVTLYCVVWKSVDVNYSTTQKYYRDLYENYSNIAHKFEYNIHYILPRYLIYTHARSRDCCERPESNLQIVKIEQDIYHINIYTHIHLHCTCSWSAHWPSGCRMRLAIKKIMKFF